MFSVFRSNLYALFIIVIWISGNFLLNFFESMVGISLSLPIQVLVVDVLFLLIPALIYLYITKLPVKNTLKLNKISLLSILLVIGFSIFIQPFMMLIGSISNLFFTNNLNSFVFDLSEFPFIVYFFILAVLPAFFEEITTRGILLSGYDDVDIKKAALVNGLFFGMLHLNFQQFFYAFALGFLFVYLVKITNSIFASIIAHFIINGSQTLLMKLQLDQLNQLGKSMPDINTLDPSMLYIAVLGALILALICTPIALLLLHLLARINKREHLLNFKLQKADIKILPVMWPIGVVFIIFASYSLLVEFT